MAVYPLHLGLTRRLGGRPRMSAFLLTLLMLLLVVGPALGFGTVAVQELRVLAQEFDDSKIDVPAPPEGIETWPLIGEPLKEFWDLAYVNLEAALGRLGPEIKAVGAWLMEAAAGAGLGLAEFAAAVIAAGFMLLHDRGGRSVAHGLARRLVGDARGDSLADLAGATVRSVARGVLGVAIIQAFLMGIGLFALGVPFSGLWTVLGVILGVVQIGVGPILVPIVIWAWFEYDPVAAGIFTAWSIFVMLSDNILRPMLLGRGVSVPMPVVFLGSLGGMLRSGIIGLFLGAVILSLGYSLLVEWIERAAPPEGGEGEGEGDAPALADGNPDGGLAPAPAGAD